jgi:hypothetical protein
MIPTSPARLDSLVQPNEWPAFIVLIASQLFPGGQCEAGIYPA